MPSTSASVAVAQADAFIATQRGRLDAATVSWVDQAAARLAAGRSLATLVDAWHHEPEIEPAGIDEEEDELLARLVTAIAIVAKVRGPTERRSE
ncbi:MAG TPA: hypothetical protein VIB48_24910 [Acidimicrobiia bacterium]